MTNVLLCFFFLFFFFSLKEPSRIQRIKVLRDQLTHFQERMSNAEQQLRLAVAGSRDTPQSRLVNTIADLIDQLTPQLMSAARMLAGGHCATVNLSRESFFFAT